DTDQDQCDEDQQSNENKKAHDDLLPDLQCG
ncbi:MAG: hypothetical protein RL299_1162, partial [Pseudomonadota bacterium]